MASSRVRKPSVIRYAVVGLGHIAQVAVLPAFAHARRNSQLVTVVSDDAVKRREAEKRYRLERSYSYKEYEDCLKAVDAVYIALPNALHAEYTIRAAQAGVHVLCEKPMASSVKECRRMIRACDSARVKLMVAYRLHFEELNLSAVEVVRRGKIGEPKFFNSSFALTVRPGNIRTKSGLGGGTLFDIGIYCINAARYIFRSEPTEVIAMSVNSGLKRFSEIDESTAAAVRFEGERIATFVSSFNAADVGEYRVVGTKGQLHVNPAYEYAEGLEYELTIGEKKTRKSVPKRDQFASELLYFSDCILKNQSPEPSGQTGMQDVRIIEALYKSAKTRRAVRIPAFEAGKQPHAGQIIKRPGIAKPKVVRVKSAHRS